MFHLRAPSVVLLSLVAAQLLRFPPPLCASLPASNSKKEEKPSPWFTGPLLTPSGHVIPNGHYNLEPYEFATVNQGVYDSHWNSDSTPNFYDINTQALLQFGLPCNFDVFATPSWSWHNTEGASQWVLNDLPVGFDYQLCFYQRERWWPATKLSFQLNLPIGKYQKLHPRLQGTDIGGSGNFAPALSVVMSHLFWCGGHVFFSPRLSVQYTVPTPVHVKNYNAYGGGHGTRGTAFPGQSLQVLFGFEVSLTQRWVLAGDVQYLHLNKTRFKGRKGSTNGVPNTVGAPSSESFSLAPALEYNWSNNYGIIAGAWFSVAGRNFVDFTSGVIAVNIYH